MKNNKYFFNALPSSKMTNKSPIAYNLIHTIRFLLLKKLLYH